MASTLFLLEFHVKTIFFEPSYKPVPPKEDILINIKFMNVNINIDPDDLAPEKGTGKEHCVVYNMGKSYLFTRTPQDLIRDMKHHKLEISLRVKQKTVGAASISWMEDFSTMVNLFEKIGVVKAVDHTIDVDLTNKENELIARMELFLKLSCFGDAIETQFKTIVSDKKKEFVFRNPYDVNTFKCEMLSGDHEILPVMNLYNPVTKTDTLTHMEAMSWTEIFGVGNKESKCSYAPFMGAEFTHGAIPLGDILQNTSTETISICFRPDENKFFDLLNVLTTEVSTTADMTKITFTKEKDTAHNPTRMHRTKTLDSSTSDERIPDYLELTADKINKKLCKNKDCPAAKKFKEYGIGPLATGKGLGTLYGDIEPPVEYGLSHTYGTMSNYGPFGIYSRPKDPNQPYTPPAEVMKKRQYSNDSSRLRGGGPWPDQPTVIIEDRSKTPQSHSSEYGASEVLRLRGGGLYTDEIFDTPKSINNVKWFELLRLKGGGPVDLDNSGEGLKSPIKECKGVMDKFDEILAAYKKALGPCGQATCPNAPSLTQEKCRRTCGNGENIPQGKDEGVLCETPCDTERRFPIAACGQPTCAYAKYKLDLVNDDAALELQFLPPAISGKCGHPNCPYPIQPDLPPIHWDCPDPLPKGLCKNLNCPHQPIDLRKLVCPEPKPGPCGSPVCPYALPAPCELPTCPFKIKPMCPFVEEQKKKQTRDEDETCENPDCPFANENIKPSDSFDAPDLKGHFMTCPNPNCPFATKAKGRIKPKSSNLNICSNPRCPFAVVRKENVCNIPFCPYANTQNSALCNDPQCPFAENSKRNKKRKDEICENPNCPYANERQISGSTKNRALTSEICDVPNCPFNVEKCSNESAKCSSGESICDNLDCTYADAKKKESKICGDPSCPYLQPQSPCGMPECAYKSIPTSCPGVKRGSKKDGETKANSDENGKKRKRQKRSKFVYSMGNQYPGVKVGHKECVTPLFKVPPKMGWLWNIPLKMMNNVKPRVGWKPGAIQKNIAEMIKSHRQAKGLGMLRLPKFKHKDGTGDDTGDDVNVAPKPTLQIQKKDGAYWITMNPLKDPKTLVDNENPYMECTPMQFKITKNKRKKDEAGDTDSKLCYCEEEEESSSSDSELDIEFTPPAGIIHPERFKKKKNVVHCEVQYDTKDFSPEKPEAKGKGKGKGKGDKGKGAKGKGKGGKKK